MFAETMRVSIRVEVAKYELAVAWLRDLLYGSEFTKERYALFPMSLTAYVLKRERFEKVANHGGSDSTGITWTQTRWEYSSISRYDGIAARRKLYFSG